MTLPETNQSLPFALLRAREKVMGPIRAMLATSGLTEQQWRILRVLEEHGAMDASTLADRASLLLPSLSRILAGMGERDLLTRTEDLSDRRRQMVEIAPKGRHVLERHREEAQEIAANFRQTLGADDFETLLDLLRRLDDL